MRGSYPPLEIPFTGEAVFAGERRFGRRFRENGKMILNFAKMLDIGAEFDIITVAFQRQQVEFAP